jgi:hypothetical protein
VSDQPTILDRPCDAGPVFVDAAARAQERQVDQFYRDPLISVGLNGVGQLDKLASSLVGVSRLGIKEVDDGIWLASFMRYDLGYFDLEQKTLQPLDNPFGSRLSPMS